MVWIVVLGIIGFIAVKFFLSLSKDEDDLQGRTLDEKFQTIVNVLNHAVYKNRGEVTRIDKREFNLYEEGQNQIIKFHYSTGILSITWKYKYFQKEVVHKRDFSNARNLSIFEQQRIAETMISEMAIVVQKHVIDVLGPEMTSRIFQ